MDVENVKIVDGLIFGYLSRQQYNDTLRAFCNEAPSLRDGRNRIQTGADVFIQVNDQLHDKNLEQIVQAFSLVGRFDVTPELIDFGIRLRSLTNEFSTMTAMRGRSLSDNQLKLYGKRAYSKMHQTKQPPANTSVHCDAVSAATYRPVVYCMGGASNEAEYVQQLHNNAVNASMEQGSQQQSSSQQDLSYDYQSQQHATSTYTMPSSSPFVAQAVMESPVGTNIQQQATQNSFSYQISQILPCVQPSTVDGEPTLIDYGVKSSESTENQHETAMNITDRTVATLEAGQSESQQQLNNSFTTESGAHKRKTGVPHRREELVAHTAQSLIVPNGVLLDLEADGAASTASVGIVAHTQVSLLSNIDDSAMQCLDRLINGNLDEVFPFCDDHDGLSGFAAQMDNPFPSNPSNEHEPEEQETPAVYEENVPTPLDLGPAHSPLLQQENVVKSRSFDDGEIISDDSIQARASKTTSMEKEVARTEERETVSPSAHSDSRRSSQDSGKGRRDEKRIADRLKEFNRNPPKSTIRKTSTTEKGDVRDTIIQETKNPSRSSPTPSAGGRSSRDRTRRLSSLFDEGYSAPSSRDSSPHRERLNKKEEERRRRERDMEKERQRDKERLKRQRREREAQRDRDRSHRPSPERKTTDKRSRKGDDEEKTRDLRDKDRKREQPEEQKVMEEAEKRKAEDKARREMLKKKKEEELEAKRQAEQQRRAEAMKRKEEENRKRRQEEKERMEERRREEQRQREEERLRREEEKAQRRREEELRKEEEMKKAAEEEDKKDEEEEDAVETAKSDEELGDGSGDCDDDVTSETHTAAHYSEDEENLIRREAAPSQEQWIHPKKLELKKNIESSSRSMENEQVQENDQSTAAPAAENEERRRRARDEHRQTRGAVDKKGLPLPVIPRRREETKKVPAKPLEPGMMMTETNVLDRINKEMESLSSRNRISGRNRSPEEPPASTSKSSSSVRIPKRDTPVDYAEVLFSNAPVIKRTPPTPEKKRNLVIASGLTTDSVNQLVFSKAHSSRLGMFLDKVGDKHRKLMLERDCDPEISSPFYEDSDRNGARSPFGLPYSRQHSHKYQPQKRPLPASSLDSYLGSPMPSSPDIRDGESSSSRPMGKKPKIDLSRMPDIIDKLYSNK